MVVGLVVCCGAKFGRKGHGIDVDLVHKELLPEWLPAGGLLNRLRGAFGPWRYSGSHATLALMGLITIALLDAEWVTPNLIDYEANRSTQLRVAIGDEVE